MSPRNGAPTRAAILTAASALLESGGPDAVTLRSVGDTAGVSRSAAYRHFDDKADLLAALVLQTLLDLTASIRRVSGTPSRGSRLHRGCRAYVLYAVQNPHHYLLVFGDVPISEPTREIEAAADDGMRAIGELVERAQTDREIIDGPPRELATILWVMLHGLAQLHITGHLAEPRTVQGVTGIERLMSLWLATLTP